MSRAPKNVLRAAISWLDATDPGAVRRQHAQRAAFASIWDQALRVAAVDDAIHHVLNTTPTTDDTLLEPAFVDFVGVDLGAGRVDETMLADGPQGQRGAIDRIIPRSAREGPVWSLITLHAALQQLALSIGAKPATSDEEQRKDPP